MSLPCLPRIFIPAGDRRRLKQLAASAGNARSPVAPFLRSELRRADIRPDKAVPKKTVVMNSWVTYRIDWGPPQRARILFPQHIPTAPDEISILSPLGVALLGLRRGDNMPFFADDRTFRTVAVVEVEPPASADNSNEIGRHTMSQWQYLPKIAIAADEHARLSNIAQGARRTIPEVAEYLIRELDRANIAESASVQVRMGSQVEYREDDTGRIRTICLVYPFEADPHAGKISVLTPVGAALIGLSQDQSIEWKTRDGAARRLTVLKIDPETASPRYRDM